MIKYIVIITILLVGISLIIYKKEPIFSFFQQEFYSIKLNTTDTVQDLSHHEWTSSSLGVPKEYYTYTSPHFSDTQKEKTIFFFLHGYPGEALDWPKNTTIMSQTLNLYTNRRLGEYMLVFGDFNGPKITDGQYLNADLIQQPMEDYVLELIDHVANQFHYNNQDAKLNLIGISSGGYGAVNISLHNPNIFNNIVCLSGYFTNKESSFHQLISKPNTSQEPLLYIQNQPISTSTHYILKIGNLDDERFRQENERLYQIFQQKGISVSYEETDGGHNWDTWENMLQDVLQELTV